MAILDAMLELTVEKISKLLIIYKKRTLALKTNFTHTNFKDIFMYKKQKQYNLYSLAAILDAILYQGSLINCSLITRSHLEPFYAWNNLNLI